MVWHGPLGRVASFYLAQESGQLHRLDVEGGVGGDAGLNEQKVAQR